MPDAMAALADTRRELADAFDGLTAYLRSPATGLWTAPDGHEEQDSIVMVEVVTGTFDRTWWRCYATRLARRFGQDQIHIRALAIQTLDQLDQEQHEPAVCNRDRGIIRVGPVAMRAPATRRRVTAVLKKVFGLTALRPGQQAVIDAVLAGKHTLALMPTGAGKSLCYQVPAMLKPGRTVVVSPLIALMRDQFEKMSALGITAVQVNSAVSADEARRARARIGRRTVEFVFTTPEQLTTPALRALLSRAVVDLLVIDEAHCISQWGHDFRPAYVEALAAIRELGTPTILALTATAPPEVIDDITTQLKVGPLHIVNTGAHRPNLSYVVHPVASDTEKQRELLATVRRIDGAAIVYAATVRHVDELAALLRQEGVRAESYHGRMRASERAAAQDAFMSGGTPLIVATNAFGMGIDRPDVRAVVHYDLPASLDVYSQESGRAGRDGLPAECILLFQRGDRRLQTFFMAGRYPTLTDFTTFAAAVPHASDGTADARANPGRHADNQRRQAASDALRTQSCEAHP